MSFPRLEDTKRKKPRIHCSRTQQNDFLGKWDPHWGLDLLRPNTYVKELNKPALFKEQQQNGTAWYTVATLRTQRYKNEAREPD